jgi:peptidoglycan/xylan/chitin deacetylase (PgdA/CDA1 family)
MLTSRMPTGPADLGRKISRRIARHGPAKPFRMRNDRPLVSFTFDDIPASAGLFGGEILRQAGARGTFYIAGGLCGGEENGCPIITAERALALHQDGHEIGCHTFSHANVQRLTRKQLDEEERRNAAFFAELAPHLKLENFAYPYGIISLASRVALQARFASCRGIMPGLNAGTIDLGHVRAIEVYDRTLHWPDIDRLLAETVRRNGWLVFYTHDVQPDPTWIGCSPDLMKAVVERSLEAGCDIVTMREGMARIGWRPA